MIREANSVSPAAVQPTRAGTDHVATLLDQSRSPLGIDTRQLAAAIVQAANGDRSAVDQLAQGAAPALSPVEQGSLGNFIEELMAAIRSAVEKLFGGAQPDPSTGPAPTTGSEPSGPQAQAPALPSRAGGSASIPSLERIANDPAVRSAIDASWRASNPNTPGAKQEQGFWVVRDDRTGALSTVAFPSNGTRDSLTPGPVPNIAGKTTVAFFHTHPNTSAEGYVSGPSPADQRFADANGIPGIIRSHDGMYYFNPR